MNFDGLNLKELNTLKKIQTGYDIKTIEYYDINYDDRCIIVGIQVNGIAFLSGYIGIEFMSDIVYATKNYEEAKNNVAYKLKLDLRCYYNDQRFIPIMENLHI